MFLLLFGKQSETGINSKKVDLLRYIKTSPWNFRFQLFEVNFFDPNFQSTRLKLDSII